MTAAPPLTVASTSELAAAVEENLYAWFRSMLAVPGAELVEGPHCSYHHAFPSSPMFKGVWRTRLSSDEADIEIDETLAWFQTRHAPFVAWWIGPQTQPSDLPARLEARGLSPDIAGDPGMALDLHTLNEERRTPADFTIVKAGHRKALEDWRDAFVAAFDLPLLAGQAWVEATLSVGISTAPWRLYVGYLSGQPVASAILFNGAGVASVQSIGTAPAARGQGIGAAITLKPLLDVRAQGYRYGVLFASEMGYPVYQKLGFRDVGCKISRYLLCRA